MDFSSVLSNYGSGMWVYTYFKVAIAMFCFYLIFLITDNPTIVDFGYCSAHVVVGVSIAIHFTVEWNTEEYILLALLFLWYLRLGGFILVTRVLKHHKDARYEALAEGKKRSVYFLINFQFQAIVVMLTSTPLFFNLSTNDYNPLTFWIGVALISIGVVFEAIADNQLEEFKKKRVPGGLLRDGLWKYSRHPNLFYELIAWCGFALIGVNNSFGVYGWLAFIGPFLLYLVMNYLTIPVTEGTMQKRRQEAWPDYIANTNKFLPFNIGLPNNSDALVRNA